MRISLSLLIILIRNLVVVRSGRTLSIARHWTLALHPALPCRAVACFLLVGSARKLYLIPVRHRQVNHPALSHTLTIPAGPIMRRQISGLPSPYQNVRNLFVTVSWRVVSLHRLSSVFSCCGNGRSLAYFETLAAD